MATSFEDFKKWNDEADRDSVARALHGVLELHEQRHYYNFEGYTVAYCACCTDSNDNYDVLWPCATVQAIQDEGVVTES